MTAEHLKRLYSRIETLGFIPQDVVEIAQIEYSQTLSERRVRAHSEGQDLEGHAKFVTELEVLGYRIERIPDEQLRPPTMAE